MPIKKKPAMPTQAKRPATAGKSGAANAHGMATSAAARAGGRDFGKSTSESKRKR
jgi:hypothetical protein